MIQLTPIGFVRGGRLEAVNDEWGDVRARIELAPEFDPAALVGLGDYSHAEIIFLLHQVPDNAVERGDRHPRGNVNWPKVGIFAQRARARPNRLGATIVSIEKCDGRTLEVRGLDAVDGTPVLDIKPVLREFLPRDEVRQPAWATELMASYWERPTS